MLVKSVNDKDQVTSSTQQAAVIISSGCEFYFLFHESFTPIKYIRLGYKYNFYSSSGGSIFEKPNFN